MSILLGFSSGGVIEWPSEKGMQHVQGRYSQPKPPLACRVHSLYLSEWEASFKLMLES